MKAIEERIQYQFRNPRLLEEALTHPSVRHEKQRAHFDNQRLEFLGDAVLQLVVTEHLFSRYEQASEGRLTSWRSRLVSREALKVHAANLQLGQYLILGRGEEASGGRNRASTLADAFEALIGAIYLDSDIETVRAFIICQLREDLLRLEEEPHAGNPKGQLQELLQSISARSPVYQLLSQHGREHEKVFSVRVTWEGKWLAEGSGRSKKEAEIAAAAAALDGQRWLEKPD